MNAERIAVEVPLLDLKAQYRPLEDEVMAVLKELCRSQRFILGKHGKELEERIAAYSGAKHGIGVSSGTDALLVSLMALDIGPGDEVITSPYTFFATGGAVARAGARPIFCDIDPATFNLSPPAVQAFIAGQCEMQEGTLVRKSTGGRVKALMPVHLYGLTADLDVLGAIARRHRLKIIEDAAQAIGSEFPGGRRAGSAGDIGCFSFFPSKNLGAFGDAGLCVTQDDALAEKLRILRVHGSSPKYYHSLIGGNFRLDEIQAAVLVVKLRHLDEWTEARQQNAAFYDEALAESGLTEGMSPLVVTPRSVPGARHIYNQYVIRAQRRDELRQHLAAARVGTEIYYPVPLHMQRCFESLGYRPEDCPESRRAAAETLALPIYPELTREQLEHVAASIRAFYR